MQSRTPNSDGPECQCASPKRAGRQTPPLLPSRPSRLGETSRETAQLTRVGGRLFLAKSCEGAKGAKG